MRERRCDGGVAGSGGCQGNAEETINCHTSPCSGFCNKLMFNVIKDFLPL